MAGYYNNIKNDLGYRLFIDKTNDYIINYNLNHNAVMRGKNSNKCQNLGTGKQCHFYGPLVGKRILQDSFITGRGQVLSECPDCGVNYLPKSLFPDKVLGSKSTCQRTDIDPLYTKVPRSCNGLTETNILQYSQMPSNWKKGYYGYDAVINTNMQSRMPSMCETYNNPNRQNYGNYSG